MFNIFTFICLCSWSLAGVCGAEVKSVLVTEGDSVTLESALTEIQSNDVILWRFGEFLIAKFRKDNQGTLDGPDGRFRGRLKLDSQTASLTITHSRISDSGLYTVSSRTKGETPLHTFNLTVYARLPVPVISNSSSQYCSVVCSVVNVSAVSLSWYKGNRLWSNMSVSDLHNSVSLPLAIDCLDDSYICVINNPISNETTQLNNTDLCQPCPVLLEVGIISAASGSLVILAAIVIFCIWRKRRNTNQEVQTRNTEITYADPTFYKKTPRKTRATETNDVVYAGVARR